MARTPIIYATGKWQVEEPFTVESNTIYICKAIRSIDDLEARGVDVFKTFYEPFAITKQTYENDVLNLANIVTLMSVNAPTLYIPDTFILSYPDTTTMPYSHVVLSASLGAVPDTFSFKDTQEKIADLINSTLGIEVNVNVHVSGVLAEGVDMVTHQSLENQRLQRIANNRSLYTNLKEKEDTIERLRAQLEGLEQILIDEGIVS